MRRKHNAARRHHIGKMKFKVVQMGTDMLFEQIPAYHEFFGFPAATADEVRALSAAVDHTGRKARRGNALELPAKSAPAPRLCRAVDFRKYIDTVIQGNPAPEIVFIP